MLYSAFCRLHFDFKVSATIDFFFPGSVLPPTPGTETGYPLHSTYGCRFWYHPSEAWLVAQNGLFKFSVIGGRLLRYNTTIKHVPRSALEGLQAKQHQLQHGIEGSYWSIVWPRVTCLPSERPRMNSPRQRVRQCLSKNQLQINTKNR